MQGIYSRTFRFDSIANTINTVELVAQQLKPSGYWLNIQVKFMNCKLCSTLFYVVLVSFAHVRCNINFLNIVASCFPFGFRIIHMMRTCGWKMHPLHFFFGKIRVYIFFGKIKCVYISKDAQFTDVQ